MAQADRVWPGLVEHPSRSVSALPLAWRKLLGGSGAPGADRPDRGTPGRPRPTSWGMTELAPLGTVTRWGMPVGASIAVAARRWASTCGWSMPRAASLQIKRGVEALQVRGSGTVHCYFGQGNPPATDAQGWSTPAISTIDAEGNLAITGCNIRRSSGGELFNPARSKLIVGGLPGVSRWSSR